MPRFGDNGGASSALEVTTVNMATGEILAVADSHHPFTVARWVHKAQRRRGRLERTEGVAGWGQFVRAMAATNGAAS